MEPGPGISAPRQRGDVPAARRSRCWPASPTPGRGAISSTASPVGGVDHALAHPPRSRTASILSAATGGRASRTQGCSIALTATTPGLRLGAGALDEEVVGFRAAAGEDHLGRMRQPPRLPARAPHRRRGAGLAAVLVATRSIAEGAPARPRPARAAWPHAPRDRAAWSHSSRGRVGAKFMRKSDRSNLVHWHAAAPAHALEHRHVRVGPHLMLDQRLQAHRIEVGVDALVEGWTTGGGSSDVTVVAVFLPPHWVASIACRPR